MALPNSPTRPCKTAANVSLKECFADLPDPRREHLRRHLLWDIIAMTICGVVSGADSWVDIEDYANCKRDFLESFLDLPNGIPSHDTLGRVFALIDPEAFGRSFQKWVAALVEATEGRIIAIDGKTLRHSFDGATGKKPLHLVSAWATANHLTLGQRAVDDKSNEITAIPELLQLLDLHGAVVTIDAMGCQKEIAAQIDASGGDYVLSLKENQPTLHAEVEALFAAALDNDFADCEHHAVTTRAKGKKHGRFEARHYHVLALSEEFRERHPQWHGLRTVALVISERQVAGQEATHEMRYFLSSLPAKAKSLARAIRGHWGIENGLHWVLDVAFREDDSRVRKDNAPENLALLRRLAVSVLKQDRTLKVGIAAKRKCAGWDDDYLLHVLRNALADV
jgi:predicted transposase YbfD/YdcC